MVDFPASHFRWPEDPEGKSPINMVDFDPLWWKSPDWNLHIWVYLTKWQWGPSKNRENKYKPVDGMGNSMFNPILNPSSSLVKVSVLHIFPLQDLFFPRKISPTSSQAPASASPSSLPWRRRGGLRPRWWPSFGSCRPGGGRVCRSLPGRGEVVGQVLQVIHLVYPAW